MNWMPVSLCMCAWTECLSEFVCVPVCFCLCVSQSVCVSAHLFEHLSHISVSSLALVHVSVCGAVQVDVSVWLSNCWSVIDQPSVIFINQIVDVVSFIITVILHPSLVSKSIHMCFCVWYTLTNLLSDYLVFLPCIHVFVHLCDVCINCHVSCM